MDGFAVGGGVNPRMRVRRISERIAMKTSFLNFKNNADNPVDADTGMTADEQKKQDTLKLKKKVKMPGNRDIIVVGRREGPVKEGFVRNPNASQFTALVQMLNHLNRSVPVLHLLIHAVFHEMFVLVLLLLKMKVQDAFERDFFQLKPTI